MATRHASRTWLEVFKFAVYLATPIGATVYLGTGAYPYLEKIIADRAYIVYPPEAPRPPSSREELRVVEDARKKQRLLLRSREPRTDVA